MRVMVILSRRAVQNRSGNRETEPRRYEAVTSSIAGNDVSVLEGEPQMEATVKMRTASQPKIRDASLQPRRQPRFGVRTMMIFIALSAFAAKPVVDALESSSEERALAELNQKAIGFTKTCSEEEERLLAFR